MNDLAVVDTAVTIPDCLSITREPSDVLTEAKRAARELQQVIAGKAKKVIINGEQYLEFEDWLTVGRFYGVTVKVSSTNYVEFGAVRGWEASADVLLVANNQVISSAQSMCLSDEERWGNRPLFMLRSMAQTRACAKALRNVLAWVVVLAGYRPTPAEEMDGVENARPMPQRKSDAAPAAPAPPQDAAPAPNANVISDPQRKRMYAIGKKAGWTDDGMKDLLHQYGFEHSNEVTRDKYEAICAKLEAGTEPF